MSRILRARGLWVVVGCMFVALGCGDDDSDPGAMSLMGGIMEQGANVNLTPTPTGNPPGTTPNGMMPQNPGNTPTAGTPGTMQPEMGAPT